MKLLIDFLTMHYQWIFSGIGVAIISWLFVRSSSKEVNMSQKNSGKSINIQIAENNSNARVRDKQDGTE